MREVDLAAGTLRLSDGTVKPLDAASLRTSPRDGALLCTVKRGLAPEGLAARFLPAAQAELFLGVEEGPDGPALRLAGRLRELPPLA